MYNYLVSPLLGKEHTTKGKVHQSSSSVGVPYLGSIRKNVSSLLNAFFKSYNSIIARPIYTFQKNRLKIIVFFLAGTNQEQNPPLWVEKKSATIASQISRNLHAPAIERLYKAVSLLCKPYIVDLRLVPLSSESLSAQIFAEWLSKIISTQKLYDVMDSTLRLVESIMGPIVEYQKTSKTNILVSNQWKPSSSFLGGIKVQISGKLTTGSNRPRYTVKTYTRGSIAGTSISYGQHTAVNAIGSFTIKVWISNRTRIM